MRGKNDAQLNVVLPQELRHQANIVMALRGEKLGAWLRQRLEDLVEEGRQQYQLTELQNVGK